jgi:anti-sigma factor RsiW
MTCREAGPLLHALLDQELDPAGSVAMDAHLSACRACSAQYAALEKLREEIIAADLGYTPAPEAEHRLASRFLEPPQSRPGFWSGRWWSGPMVAAGIAAIALLVSIPLLLRTGPDADAAGAEILDIHLRALQPMHAVDIPSSDQHTVKPWFQGKLNFSPPVPDLSGDGFVLLGGRLEVIHQLPAAAIVYGRRQHVISLYVSPSAGADAQAELRNIDGYHLLHWTEDKLSYWAVSDVDPGDLRRFGDLIRGK